IAAISVKSSKQPRQLDPRAVQRVLLDSGLTLIQRWHSDVPWRTPVWKATQVLSLYQVMDRPGPITRDREPLAAGYPWGVNEALKADELNSALKRLAELTGVKTSASTASGGTISQSNLADVLRSVTPQWAKAMDGVKFADANRVTAGEFAQV